MAEQTTNYWTCAVSTMTSWSSEVPTLAQNVIYTSISLSVSEPLKYVGSLICMWGLVPTKLDFSLVSLSHVDLIIQPVKRTRGGKGGFFPFSIQVTRDLCIPAYLHVCIVSFDIIYVFCCKKRKRVLINDIVHIPDMVL